MSRYSPTVAPQYFGPNGSELGAALGQLLQQRREEQQASDAHVAAGGTYVANGGRYGAPPTTQQSLELPSDAGIPSSLAGAFDAASRGAPAAGQHPMWNGGLPGGAVSRPAPDDDATGGGWGTELPHAPGAGGDPGFVRRASPFSDPGFQERPSGPGAQPAPGGALAGAMQARMGGQPAPPVLTHGGGAPGSFQPVLGGFAPALPAAGGAGPEVAERPRPSVAMTVPQDGDRYIQTDPEHYIDTHQTRQGQALAQAMAMADARNAGAYDRAVLGSNTRITTTGMTNTTRQNISDDHVASADDRTADLIASRERIAQRADATRRLTASLRAANGGHVTATAQEANAHKAAAALLANYGGDYGQALDALEHTPEGQELAQSGVTRRHLYVALGQATGAEAKQDFTAAAGDQRATFSTPAQAAAKVGATRRALGSGARRGAAPANAAPPTATPPAVGGASTAPAIDPATVSDNEAAAAWNAGARTDAEILNHVARTRGRKP
jgi:hypothetical protein